MITDFRCKDTEALFREGRASSWLRTIARAAQRKLDLLDYAEDLGDHRAPPGNRLERLNGDRRGQHSIRINEKWRICFICGKDGPTEVEIVDYH
jgi:proteic killer suppression protein